MNGGQALIRTLVDCGVDVCFMNPGTSEMHFVAALDAVADMRGVLALFEGVATGAADGYGRMSDRPAGVLLHLGPGLGNGLANLHNARRAHTPVVNVVGDHATSHRRYDAPLDSDIDSLARNVSGWIRRSRHARDVARDAADAVAAARTPPGQVATLILPADVSWDEGGCPAASRPVPTRTPVPDSVVEAAADAVRSGAPTVLLLGGGALRQRGVLAAARVSAATGVKLLAETFPARLERGAGLAPISRLAYFPEPASAQLAGTRRLILVDARSPVSFFAYPGKPSDLVPDGCEVQVLAQADDDAVGALEALADMTAGGTPPPLQALQRPDRPSGLLDIRTLAAAVGAVLPDGAVVVDEANTSGVLLPDATAGAPPHDWLTLTGGAIGQGLPTAVGAAIASPERPVICLEADGSALYTMQSLWTMAQLNVTTVVLNNGAYAILRVELSRVGAELGGLRALDMLDLRRPDLDFVALGRGFGVDSVRVDTAEDLVKQLDRGTAEAGPHLIEARLPSPG